MKKSISLMIVTALLVAMDASAGMYFYNKTDKDVMITPCVGANWMSMEQGSFERPTICKSSRQKTLPALKNNKKMVATGYEGPNAYIIKIGNKEWSLAQNGGNWYVRNENGKDRMLGLVLDEDQVIFIADTTGEKPFDMPKALPGVQAVNPKMMWPDKLILNN